MKRQKFIVMNLTDGTIASPEEMSKRRGEQFIKDFPSRYQHQGYYLTRDRERIAPEDVILELQPV